MMTIKRDSQPYRDIESFEDYELTKCCMYEMAIRSEWFNEQLQDIVDLYGDYTAEEETVVDLDAESLLDVISTSSAYSTIMDKCIGLGLHKHIGYPTTQSELGKRVQNIYRSLTNTPKHTSIDNSDVFIERIPAENKTYITRYVQQEACSIQNIFSIDSWLIKDDIEPGIYEGDNTVKAKEILNDLASNDFMRLIKKDISINSNFKRPYLSALAMEGLNASVTLDFSLPKHELLSYISHIKDSLDEYPSIVPPIDLLNKELSEVFTIAPLEKKKGSKQHKRATMFYIYDAFKAGMKQSDIKIEISYYNGGNTDERTIKEYHRVMKEFIDEGKFKHLTRFITL